METDRKKMTIIEHLEELRRRIIISFLALIFFSVVCYFISPRILEAVHRSLPGVDFLIFTSLGEAFWVTIKIAVYAGVVLALPVVLWEIWAFISPALEGKEKILVGSLLPFMYFLFISGLAFAFFVALPWTVKFFMSYAHADLKAFISIDSYISFLFSLGFTFGLVFQFPLLILLLVKLGLIRVELLRRYRKYAILIVFLAVGFLPWVNDIVSQIIMAVPMIILYELGILLAVIFK